MYKIKHMTESQNSNSQALKEVLEKYQKACCGRSKKEKKEIEESMYRTTCVTLDNLTSSDL